MRSIPYPPERSLTICDADSGVCLRVTGSNKGEPYRRTLLLSLERGPFEHIGSVELSGDEEEELRVMLNARQASRLRGARFEQPPGIPEPAFVVWDLDRIMEPRVSVGNGLERLATMSSKNPHATFHLLATVAYARNGTAYPVRTQPIGEEP